MAAAASTHHSHARAARTHRSHARSTERWRRLFHPKAARRARHDDADKDAHHSDAGHAAHRHGRLHFRRRRERGQAAIEPQRAREIQQALVNAGYLKSRSGYWDARTAAAMRRFQQQHHWQTRFVPDARALAALGLGAPYDARPGQRPIEPERSASIAASRSASSDLAATDPN
jgi:hypothetical protein